MKLISLLLALAVSASPLSQAAPAKKSGKKSAHSRAKAGTRAGARAAAPPVAVPAAAQAGDPIVFSESEAVNAFADELALRNGFPRAELAALIGQIRYVDAAVQLVKPAPKGKPKNWQNYSRATIEPVRIKAGVAFWNQHAAVLARAQAEYGVPAEVIVGIIGVETIYGKNTGRFRVLDVLTTLAFAYPEAPNQAARMAFFRGELENALLLARKANIDPLSMLGSFAGAIGMPQFMPGSVLAYGVDYDNDGSIDLRNSAVDAIGSVASFLVQHGWQPKQSGPIVYPARVSDDRTWESFLNQGLAAKFRAEELRAGGVSSSAALPASQRYGLIDLPNGSDPTEYRIATDNFFAITQYNRSYFYAMSVIELGRAIRLSRAGQPLASEETL
ncbi:lytic murein transglycosylase B [Massilia antarctica]|uniref:lytic murein transglycosylase B n=1 Tax=Massilia antarctica TaxID=2765360 RepID=UPI0006BB96DA|nr:lytic murein transglycosylase B [Massilia sp. H27-R4]MCY0914808.1 lytic murein transglycosylase B [Massilia sp. H27-R4]CUI08153.1 Membrane-bound lytic murein transglycosylase B precursor [Janthinobacterium sp. CG23_2]CUU31939.1 Membrane-bound lytic murein transglycosylase B precursor [Janthinobacterium sp. CG23_2]